MGYYDASNESSLSLQQFIRDAGIFNHHTSPTLFDSFFAPVASSFREASQAQIMAEYKLAAEGLTGWLEQ
jgi:hypothetical protein